ncbi:unnamed protein product [Adineta ricciae]|uniref:Uncharacterized protein n=1 Tax=Adineta ricciae TaxID=249248 RepID=A0A814TF58_ADIRI|nr:unnamed protein product [Adineta ricciae]
MQLYSRAFAIIILIIVLIISIIHVGVSVGIVRNFRQYGDIFQRERSLSVYNIVIGAVGILISLFGLIAVIARRLTFSKITAFGYLLLALCALASLIAAIGISFVGANYINSRFLNNMNNYKYNANVRTSIDNIQKDYDCCGSNMWLDWDVVSLLTVPSDTDSNVVQTSSSQSAIYATPIMNTMSNRTSTSKQGSTTNAIVNTDVEVIVDNGLETTAVTDTGSTTITTPYIYSTTTRKQNPRNRNTTHTAYYYDVLAQMGLGSLVQSSKKKRAAQTKYVNTNGSPLSSPVTLPQSCCTNDVSPFFNSLDPYCISNVNNVPSSFHHSGCSQKIAAVAASRSLSIAFMNGFLVLFAFLAVPILKRTYGGYVRPSKSYRNSSLADHPFSQDNHPSYISSKDQKTSVINPHNDYSIYQ